MDMSRWQKFFLLTPAWRYASNWRYWALCYPINGLADFQGQTAMFSITGLIKILHLCLPGTYFSVFFLVVNDEAVGSGEPQDQCGKVGAPFRRWVVAFCSFLPDPISAHHTCRCWVCCLVFLLCILHVFLCLSMLDSTWTSDVHFNEGRLREGFGEILCHLLWEEYSWWLLSQHSGQTRSKSLLIRTNLFIF